MKEVLDYKLLPENYNIKMEVLENEFNGIQEVKLKVQQRTSTFNLNSASLEILEMRAFINNEEKSIDHNFENEKINVSFVDFEVEVNDEIRLYIKYKGLYSEDMWGVYKSKYNDDLLFSTDFEPTNARRAFPCWDQPDMKATFDISVKPMPGLMALSNSSIKKIEDGWYVFNTTPKMSTYIVAFVCGKFDFFGLQTTRGIPIKVWAHKDEIKWGEYACKVAVECLDFFENYFAINYPLPKLDLIAIPTFVSGAMENWGLVTFRKTSLLYDYNTGSSRTKKRIAETVCHEIAHMWFGNLVTMIWWNDLWLNEGFATWASYLAMSNISQSLIDWDVWTEFITSDIEAGMLHDCLNSSHPIAVTVHKPSEINQIFDTISYSKGASMIRMLENYIGEDAFKTGIRNYLSKFEYSNACTDDLWESFAKEYKVQEIMNDWINKQGFPIINITESNKNKSNEDLESTDKKSYLIIQQERFLISGTNEQDTWKIPLKIQWLNEDISTETILMTEKCKKIERKSKIYKFNEGASGFYRVKYPLQNLAELLKLNLSTSNRLNILNDVFALVFSNRMFAIDGIVLSELFTRETDFKVLGTVLQNLSKIRSIFADQPKVVKHINEVIWDITGERAKLVDLTGANIKSDDLITNNLLLSYCLSTDDQEISKKLMHGFELYKEGKYVNPEYLRTIFVSVAEKERNLLFKLALESVIPEEKTMALSALASIKNEQMLKETIGRYNELEPHNSIYFFLYLPENITNRNTVISSVLDKFDNIRTYIKNDRLFQYIVEEVLGCVSAPNLVDQVVQLLQSRKNGDIVMKIDKTIEKIQHNQDFREHNIDLINERD